MTSMSKHGSADVVILGGGFAGLRAARLLGRFAGQLNLRVVLIDKEDHQIYTPSLYEIVGGHTPRQVCIPIRDSLAGLPVEFIQATAKNIVVNKCLIELAGGTTISFRHLILAIGSVANYYDIKGVEQYAFPLKTARDAWVLRQHIETEFVKAAETTSKGSRAGHLRLLIAGGGPAGVELAGELAYFTRTLARRHHVPHRQVNIELLEASPEILGRFKPDVIDYVRRTLGELGVTIHTQSPVKEEKLKSVVFGATREVSETLVWTAGVTVPPLLAKLKAFAKDKAGRLIVDGYMRANGAQHIWVVGDCVSAADSGVATAAMAHADCAAGNIVRLETNQPLVEYEPTVPALAMPIGHHDGIFQYDGLTLKGPIIRLIKAVIDLNYFASILPLGKALRLWTIRRESCPDCGRRFRETLWPHGTIA